METGIHRDMWGLGLGWFFGVSVKGFWPTFGALLAGMHAPFSRVGRWTSD